MVKIISDVDENRERVKFIMNDCDRMKVEFEQFILRLDRYTKELKKLYNKP